MKPILFSTPMVEAILAGRKTQTRRAIAPRHEGGMFQIITAKDEPDFPGYYHNKRVCTVDWDELSIDGGHVQCPYGEVGDHLWVRESWRITSWCFDDGEMTIEYADGAKETVPMHTTGDDPADATWLANKVDLLERKGYFKENVADEVYERTDKPYPFSPSIHMPFEAARIFLEIKDIRVERLQDISEEDAIAEGIEQECHEFAATAFPDGDYVEYNPRPKIWQRMNYLKSAEIGIPHFQNFSAKDSFRTLWQSINGADSWDSNPWVWTITFERMEVAK